ncbi:MAG TPA: preprotein translocase subunit SecY [Candidatus Dojkabacteria bacterium]|nr:preprotein translocase subunit SecY [Candidatus Dojkabacteria bacterium]
MPKLRQGVQKVAANVKKAVTLPLKLPLGFIKTAGNKVKQSRFLKSDQNSLLSALKNLEIRRKLLFTLGIIIVYRLLSSVPIPGIDIKLFNEVFGNSSLNSLFTVVTGGRLDQPSVVAIGLGAYINASIIIQMLSTVIPKFEELSKEGEHGKRVLNMYTRILSVPLTIIQAIVIYTVLKSAPAQSPELAGLLANVTTFDVVTMIAALTAGSIILMWLAELIEEYGIGNGSSIIIMISILSIMPSLINTDFSFIAGDLKLLVENGNLNVLLNENFILVYAILLGLFILVGGIVFITEATRKVTIQYARRFRGNGVAQDSYLPLKINQAGVMPVIFAFAMLTFPQIIGQILSTIQNTDSIFYKIGDLINNSFLGARTSLVSDSLIKYQLVLFILIFAFSFFYTFVVFKPKETADNLKKSGGFIPGIRPGVETEKYITKILVRLTTVGGIFLAVIAIIPNLVQATPQGATLTLFRGIGGTSLLIVVGVILDTMRRMKSLAVTRSYDQYR